MYYKLIFRLKVLLVRKWKSILGFSKSINEEDGFHWKIWTENEETKEAGGIYVFEEKQDAENTLKCTKIDFKHLVLKILE